MTLHCHCPENFPAWDGKDVALNFQPILKLGIPMLFHMPLAYEAYVQRQHLQIQQLELEELWPGFVLTRTGFLRGRIVRPIKTSATPSRHVSHFPSAYQVRAAVHHGDIGTTLKPIRNMQMALVDEGKAPQELYLSYLTCPRCEEQRGGTKIMLVRHWVDSPALKKKLNRR